MKYCKKPVIIEAFQLGIDAVPDWFSNNSKISMNVEKVALAEDPTQFYFEATAYIIIPEAIIFADHEWYVIRKPDGSISVCDPKVFIETYDQVAEPKNTSNQKEAN